MLCCRVDVHGKENSGLLEKVTKPTVARVSRLFCSLRVHVPSLHCASKKQLEGSCGNSWDGVKRGENILCRKFSWEPPADSAFVLVFVNPVMLILSFSRVDVHRDDNAGMLEKVQSTSRNSHLRLMKSRALSSGVTKNQF